MSRIRPAVGFATIACISALPAISSAQSRLFVFGSVGGAEVSLETGAIRGVNTHDVSAPDVVDGGRYLAAFVPLPSDTFSMQRRGLRIWSPRMGNAFTAAEFTGERFDREPVLVGDANHARVFVWNVDRITSVTAAGVVDIITGIIPPPAHAGVTLLPGARRMAYAPVSEVLFAVRQGATIDDIELAQYGTDGTLLRVHTLPAVPDFLAVSSDARHVFTVTFVSPSGTPATTLRRYDAVTGAEHGAVDLHDGALGYGPRGLLLDETRERVLVPFGATPSFLEVLGFDLTPLQIVRYPTGQTLCRFDIGVDERTGAAAIASTEWHGSLFGGAQNPRVSLVDLATGALIASAPLTNPLLDNVGGTGCGGGVVVLTPPPAPRLEPPLVAGDAVTLTWPAVRTATNYQVEAGPASGATAFTARTNGNLSLTVTAVPPGTYYVRLRALNDSGASAASPEIVVTVP